MLWFMRTHITVTDIADKLDIICGSAYFVIHNNLGYHKIMCKGGAKAAYR